MPLSPHLQVYKLPLPALMSITHRITGVGLCVGILYYCFFLYALATSPENILAFEAFMKSWFGMISTVGLTFSFVYHWLNGIRHLLWDIPVGLDVKTVYQSGFAILGATVMISFILLKDYFA